MGYKRIVAARTYIAARAMIPKAVEVLQPFGGVQKPGLGMPVRKGKLFYAARNRLVVEPDASTTSIKRRRTML